MFANRIEPAMQLQKLRIFFRAWIANAQVESLASSPTKRDTSYDYADQVSQSLAPGCF